MTNTQWSYLSSSMIKEIAAYGGDISTMVLPPVHKLMLLEGSARVRGGTMSIYELIDLLEDEIEQSPKVVMSSLHKVDPEHICRSSIRCAKSCHRRSTRQKRSTGSNQSQRGEGAGRGDRLQSAGGAEELCDEHEVWPWRPTARTKSWPLRNTMRERGTQVPKRMRRI